MQLLSMVWGISVGIVMVIAFIPCLGWINWINIPLAIAGLIVSLVAITSRERRSATGSIFGIVGCSMAIFFGTIRLIIGAGLI